MSKSVPKELQLYCIITEEIYTEKERYTEEIFKKCYKGEKEGRGSE